MVISNLSLHDTRENAKSYHKSLLTPSLVDDSGRPQITVSFTGGPRGQNIKVLLWHPTIFVIPDAIYAIKVNNIKTISRYLKIIISVGFFHVCDSSCRSFSRCSNHRGR